MDEISPIAWAHRYAPKGLIYKLFDTRQDAEEEVRVVGGSAHVVALYDQAAIDAAVDAERERCAKVCIDRSDAHASAYISRASKLRGDMRTDAASDEAYACAEAIRGA